MSTSAFPSSAHAHASPAPLSLPVSAARPSRGFELGKRAIDVAGSALLLLAVLPLLAAIALGVKLSSPGPVFYRQRRLGRAGIVFGCYKFRSMVADAEERLLTDADMQRQFEDSYKIRDDPRVTRFGAFLRRSSLDELPQLWNVLRGDMSLVGPRPIVEPELIKYGRHAVRLLTVKPGLGGLWQVSGRSETSYGERVALDMRYIETRSLGLDLKLILLTAWTVLRGRGAY